MTVYHTIQFQGDYWKPTLENAAYVYIIRYYTPVLAVKWTETLQPWHLHDIIKSHYPEYDRNNMVLISHGNVVEHLMPNMQVRFHKWSVARRKRKVRFLTQEERLVLN